MLQTTVNGSYNLLLHLQNTVVVALQPAVLFPCSFCLPQLSYSLSVLRAVEHCELADAALENLAGSGRRHEAHVSGAQCCQVGGLGAC